MAYRLFVMVDEELYGISAKNFQDVVNDNTVFW